MGSTAQPIYASGQARRMRPNSGSARITSPIAPISTISTRRGIGARLSVAIRGQDNSRVNVGATPQSLQRDSSHRLEACATERIDNSPAPLLAYSLEIEGAALPRVNQADQEDPDKNCGFDKTKYPELAQVGCPGIEEHNFNVENQK